jgi:hypothetical protein
MAMIVLLWIVFISLISWYWTRDIGLTRSLGAGLCRAGWTLPIILSLYPETVTKRIPGTVALQPVHILVDDSDSMASKDPSGGSSSAAVKSLLKRVDDVCLQFGCLPKITLLSESASETKNGFSPLSRVIEPWLYKTGGEPWMILSDGGDFRPSTGWDDRLKGRGEDMSNQRQRPYSNNSNRKKTLGLIGAFGSPRFPGISVESVMLAPLAFEGKNIQLSATIERVNQQSAGISGGAGAQRVQVQALLDGHVVASTEALFGDGAESANIEMSFSAPKRGPHTVTIKALAVAGELDTWDNSQTRVLDVMPNTVGVLHLLGSPAWDGRFMRRFLKAEPKFDVISFFILRDPWDSQQVSEREMSLIPFPVERLFKEELVNFRVIVMQNFTLMRFLQPEYQENLAKFVKDGGGLLFIGGPRALTETDTTSSSLAGLLPFTVESGAALPNKVPRNPMQMDEGFGGMGSSWDPEASFKVEMAAPEASRRSLANVYETWLSLGGRLSSVSSMKGLHRMETLKFREKEITPLLNARTKDGRVVPLAVASYPGKGRALWVFSDSLWRLAMSSNPLNARSDYHEFMDGALSWLTRGDMKGTLTVRDFKIMQSMDQTGKLKWHASFYGPAARHLKSAATIRLSVCGVVVPSDLISFGAASGESIEADGEVNASLGDGALCSLRLDADHPSFGSLNVSGWSVVPETLPDARIGPSAIKLKQLAKLTGAGFVDASTERSREIEEWLQIWGASDGKALPDKMKSTREFYWPLELTWVWLLFLLLPVEVILRRWHLIVGNVRDRSGVGQSDAGS